MINYFIANGRADVIYPYTEAMEPFGIFYLATVSAFFPEMRAYPRWATAANVGPDDVITQYAKGLADDSRVVGYYTCDECASERQPRTFHQYSLIKKYDPGSITFAVENFPNEYQFWRDTVDVLGCRPVRSRHPLPGELRRRYDPQGDRRGSWCAAGMDGDPVLLADAGCRTSPPSRNSTT